MLGHVPTHGKALSSQVVNKASYKWRQMTLLGREGKGGGRSGRGGTAYNLHPPSFLPFHPPLPREGVGEEYCTFISFLF